MLGFLFFVLLSLICYFSVYLRKKDVLHPLGVLPAVWFLMAGVACLQIGDFQKQWCLETTIIIVISGMACYFFAVPGKGRTSCEGQVSSMFSIVTRIVFFCCLAVILYNLYRNSFFTNGLVLEAADKKTANMQYTQMNGRLASYAASYMPYCALNSVFELTYPPKEGRKWAYHLFVIVFAVWFAWSVSYSRGTLLVMILGTLYIYHARYHIRLVPLILAGGALLLLLGALMMLRIGEGSLVFGGATQNALINSVYNYIAYCFQNLDAIVRDGSQHGGFLYVWQSIYKLLGQFDESRLSHYQTLFYNAETFLAPFYQDLGIVGVIVYPSLVAMALSWFYQRSKQNIYAVLLLANLQKAIFTAFFGNYFITALSVMFPYLVTAGICLVSYKCKDIAVHGLFVKKAHKVCVLRIGGGKRFGKSVQQGNHPCI